MPRASPRPASVTAGAEKSVTSARRGQDEEGPASGTTGGKGRRFPAAWPASFPIPSDADRTGCSRERAPGHGGRRARRLPPGLRSFGSNFLAAPGPSQLSARPSPGLAFRGSPFLPRPSPSSLLSWPFLSAELSSAPFSCQRFWTAPEYPALPGLLTARLTSPDPQSQPHAKL